MVREILISINIEEFNKVDCPFTIKWTHGAEIGRTTDAIECTLHPGDNVSFILEFKPRKRGSFSAEAPIYIRGELDDGVFNKLRLNGEFPASSIDVEPTEIYFMPVPLGTEVEEKFRIRAKHFDNTAFIRPNFLTTPRCRGDYKNELLRVDFPNGNVVPPQSYVELEAKVTFKSNQPVSFCSIIEFSDDNQLAVCFLTIYATADNNLLTTYIHSIKSSFDETYSKKHISLSCPSILLESLKDDDIEEIPDNHRAQRKNLNTSCASHKRLSRQLFELRNKQCWLDVTLQTYKCLVLRGIHEYKFWISPRSTGLPRQYELHERAIESIANSPSCELASDRCSEEKFLLAWLRYHYEQQRERDWMTDRHINMNPQEKQDVAKYRAIQNFHYDLSDSLVLIAVTAAYCPFLIDKYFNNLYICSRNNQEMLHNAICLITAWRKIRLGFIITPMQLVNPNQVQILMLVVHLFQVLPTYVPCAKIKFNCSLSQIITKQINISNPTDNIVNYLLLLINNDNNFFTILRPVSILHLNAHDCGQIQIQFHAKKIQKNRAYLMLCGRAIGPYFGRNQTIILEGCIDNLGIASKYTIRSKLYQIVEINLKISVPYQNAAKYDIWMTDERPNNPLTLKMTRWQELRARKIPRRLFLNQESIIVAEGASETHLSISVACIIPKQRTFWLIFQAKTGDFIIQINSIWQKSVNDRIVVQWAAQGECVCSNQRSDVRACPFNISIPIPSCNVQFRRCVIEMFKKTLEPREHLFWSKYSNTYIELQLIKWLMRSDFAALEFMHVFNTAVTYKVTISDKSSPLILPECFTIQDVSLTNQQVPMIVHILPTTPPLYEATLTLTSLDDKEFRVYIIDCLRS